MLVPLFLCARVQFVQFLRDIWHHFSKDVPDVTQKKFGEFKQRAQTGCRMPFPR